jgi:hypothetical protein
VAIDTNAPRSRRAILAGALGGAGALAIAALGRAAPVAAATGDNVVLGEGEAATDNAADAPTIVNSAAANPVLGGITDGSGAGLHGRSGSPPPDGTDFTQVGVYGFSDTNEFDAGIWGDTIQGVGVVGTGDWGITGLGFVGGVGLAPEPGTGLHGFSGSDSLNVPAAGAGVHGHAGAGASYGVYASAATSAQSALYVNGSFRTSRSARRAISASWTSIKVTVPGATTGSWAVATLQTSVSGCYVRAAVPSANALTIYLSKAPGKTVYVGYLVMG